MDIKSETLKIGRTLQAAGIPYAFCGAIALAIHGYPRATKDIDILISEDDLDSVRKALAPCGFDLDVGFIRFDTGTSRARKIFRTSKAEGRDLLTVDLLIVSEVYREIFRDRDIFQLDDQELSVVSREGLISMKKLAGRPQDLADIVAMEQVDHP